MDGDHETFHRAIHEEEEIYVFTFCKSGRHRSLANQRLLQFIVSRNGTLTTSTSSDDTTAEEAAPTADGKPQGAREKAMVCVDLARKLWKENAEELKASKAGGTSAPSSAGAASDPSGGASTAPQPSSSLQWSWLGSQSLSLELRSRRHQVVTLVRVGGGQPSSAKCLKKFMAHWAPPFGWPKIISHDRGLHNRGAFAHGLAAHGCQIRQAGLESPEHIGRCERHGGIIKRAYRRIVRQHNLSGKAEVKEAMLEAQVSKNEFLRVGGFVPVQWVLGRLPRGVGHVLDEEELGQLGVLAGMQDPSSAFGRRAEFRHTARKAYVKQDCSLRARPAILRRAAPLPGRYQAGDLVCYRIAREGNASWSTVVKIIGFDHKTVWVVHQGVPVATSLGRLRPCMSAEVLAYQVLNRGNLQFEHVDAEREQRRYIDAREDVRLDDPDEAEMASATPGAATAAPPGPSQAAERAVRRRVGPTAEESRAVTRETVEEPEDEEQAGDDLLPEVPETSSGTSSETGVEVEAVDTTEAASA